MYLPSPLCLSARGPKAGGACAQQPKRLLVQAASDKSVASYGAWTQVERAPEGQPLTHRSRSEPSRLADREERLWERSDKMWERELARWDSERRAWDAREAQLLQQGMARGLAARGEAGMPAAASANEAVAREAGGPASEPTGVSAPLLAKGTDDIFWVHQLHEALGSHGFYPDDDEAADWYFGDHTASALTSFQAGRGLPETGLAAKWPILREGDGGREVHSLHIALSRAGFSCHEDELEWWQFGDTTFSALITFQACSGLSESGVADERTWQALLGKTADPATVQSLLSGDDTDTDLTGSHESQGVWLVGEQRWERRQVT
ncbi:hypothetical protein WJX81_006803 [Elliptochloris bilobata]|uniref:Peptidoglycan binding-like domain-containing protein n=1 Tax=Elliptochloris bilobata TaxID=381761 RepID=A0AAW1S277_9CHLO